MKGKKPKKMSLDFTGVEKEIRKRGKRIAEGDYVFKISGCEKRKKEGGDSYYFSWALTLIEDARGNKKHAGMSFYYVTSLKPEALFNLRNLINAAIGKNVSGKRLDFDPSSLIGKKVGGTVEDDEYDGKVRSRVVDVMPVSDIQEAEDDEDEDDVEDADDDDDSDDDDDDESDDDTDDEDDDEDEDDDDEDDDDDDDEPEPVKKKGKKEKPAKGKKGKKGKKDDDDLDEVDEDDL